MPVPADIRAVPRPVNTIVDDNGGNGPKRYAVRQRGSSKYVSGGNPQPKNGKVIGHIIDHKYVPIPEKNPGTDEPDMLSYGASALVKSVTADLKEDLLAVYDASDVYAMMSLATLRVIKPAITADRARTHYLRTFVCKDYPGAAMSRNSIGSLLQRIGMNGSRRRQFYQLRMQATAADHHIAIDGMLKQDNSKVNDLSAFSRKEADILVATTVIEVGVDVPNATVMMIENAERFGLATLHQLRGRVGRSDLQSYCIFMAGVQSEDISRRLDILNHSNNGFEIAEKDFELRGPGDLLGIRQSGDAAFRIADISRDRDILKAAGELAAAVMHDDPALILEEHDLLRIKMREYMHSDVRTIVL